MHTDHSVLTSLASPVRSRGSIAARLVHAFVTADRRWRDRQILERKTDADLADVGLTRGDVARARRNGLI